MIFEIIAGVYIALCVIGFFYFILHKNYRNAPQAKPVEHYEKVRDKVVKTRNKVEYETDYCIGIGIPQIVSGLIVISLVLGIGMMVINQVKSAITEIANVSGITDPIGIVDSGFKTSVIILITLSAIIIIGILMKDWSPDYL